LIQQLHFIHFNHTWLKNLSVEDFSILKNPTNRTKYHVNSFTNQQSESVNCRLKNDLLS
jgi:hypothetical protein